MKLKQLQNILDTDKCALCESKEQLTIDHKIPKSFFTCFQLEAVADNRLNLQILCGKCNVKKGSYIDLSNQWNYDTVNRIIEYARNQQSIFKE